MKKFLVAPLIALLFGAVYCTCSAQNPIHLGSMKMSYRLHQDTFIVSLEAPTKGWLAIGFNDVNNIIHSDLMMLKVQDGKVYAEDQYVKGPQNNPPDQTQGGTHDLFDLKGEEVGNRTIISFKRLLKNADTLDYQHTVGENFWLIMAYSISDDFNHHSIMRKHTRYKWQ